MAYDHNLRQKRNAQKKDAQSAAAQVFEPKSQREKRTQLTSASRSTWLATFGVLLAMGVTYWIINHFGTKGLKSSEQSSQIQTSIPESAQQPAVTETDLNSDSSAPTVNEKIRPNEMSPEQRHSSVESPSVPLPTPPSAQIPPEKELNRLKLDSLPLPEGVQVKPEMTFYEEMSAIEVPLDDAKKYPILLEVPEYIIAGSFFNEASAKRELNRLSQHGQQLTLVATQSSSGRTVYVLKTQAYDNRRELGARKNALRDLGARVRSYPVKP